MKTPSTIIRADDPDTIVKKVKHIRFKDLIDRIKITKTPDKEEVAPFHIFPDQDYKAHSPNRETLVLYFKEWYDVLAIKEALTDVTCEYTDGPKPIFHIQLKNDSDIGMYYEQHIRKTTIRGMKGAEQTIKVKSPGSKVYHVETSLSDLIQIMELKNIDLNSINTNDIHAVARVYGIEAARGTLIREIRQILAYYGIYVNMRHITLAVDWMTWIGALTPLTRHGIRRMDTSPLKRSTFEEVVDVFNQAACSKEVDELNGISECIITGAPPKLGTNVVGTIVDHGIIKQFAQPYPKEISMFDSSRHNETWLVQDDEEDIYGTKPQFDPWQDERNPWETHMQPPMLQPFGFQSAQPQFPGMQAQLPGMQMGMPLPGMQMGMPLPGMQMGMHNYRVCKWVCHYRVCKHNYRVCKHNYRVCKCHH